MSKSPFQDWLSLLERRKNHSIFLVEWMSIFLIAWMFWSAMFIWAPGSIPPGMAGTLVAFLYATCIVYGRLMKATGCRKCASPLPFVRKEVGRRHQPDEEHCIEVQYGGEEYGQHMIQVYCKITRADIVTYRCRECDQIWDERVEVGGSGYKMIRRIDH